ncbi:hypothetical protein HDU97_002285 [Phlyctochytrium planicorne]|nr:hypothetical protein HDU97_002285 [Phlyctochytrium planicorne]
MLSFFALTAFLGLASSVVAQNCYNVPDGNIICSGAANNTFRICNKGVASVEVQNCAANLVCCGNSCVYPSDQLCFPPISPNCKGVPDYQTVCTSRKTFNYCLKEKLYPYTNDQSCPSGTVCCPNSGRCDYESACNIFNQPSPSPASPPAASPSPAGSPGDVNPSPSPSPTSPKPAAATLTLNSCAGVDDYKTTCVNDKTYIYCLKAAPYPNSGPMPCAPGTVCCASTGLCDYAYNCPAKSALSPSPVINGASPVPSPAALVPPQANCSGILSGDIVCTGSNTYNVCVNGGVYSTGKCAEGTICCTTTNRCDFEKSCGSAGVVVPSAPAPAPLPVSPCAGIPDGFKICSNDGFSIFTCQSNFIFATETCLYGSKCCGNTKTCAAAGLCPNSCSGKPAGFILCNGNKFDICNNGAANPSKLATTAELAKVALE